jgi:CRP/FNR family transcriptional regulator
MTWNHAETRDDSIALALSQTSLFETVEMRHLRSLALRASTRQVDRGAMIYAEKSRATALYIVQSGGVKLYRNDSQGHEQVFKVVRAGESFGEENLFSDCGNLSDACAVEETIFIVIPKADLQDVLKQNAVLATSLLRAVGEHFDLMVRVLGDRKLQTIATRVGNWLLENCRRRTGPQKVQVRGSKRLLASELGVTSETLSRTLKLLSENQLIVVHGRTFLLPNPERLKELLDRGLDRALKRAPAVA